MRVAYAGVSHPAPEVRRRACLHLAAHPDPRHAVVLLPALNDSSPSVAAAAVTALGMTGRLDDTAPLRRLMTQPDLWLRLEVATALLRLHDPAGCRPWSGWLTLPIRRSAARPPCAWASCPTPAS